MGQSIGRMNSALEEAEGHVVGGRSRRSSRRSESRSRSGSRRGEATSAILDASRVARIEQATRRQAKGGSRTGNQEVDVQGTTMHGIGTRSQSIGNPKIALTTTSDPRAKEMAIGEPDVSVCGAQ